MGDRIPLADAVHQCIFNWYVFHVNATESHVVLIVVSVVIASRIWWVSRRINRMTSTTGRSSTLGRAGSIIIESGAMYSSCLVLLIALYLCGSYAQFVVLNAMTQVVVSDTTISSITTLSF